MIIIETEEHAALVQKAFEHVGLSPVIVIIDNLHLVCRNYDESVQVMSLNIESWRSTPPTPASLRNPQREEIFS